VESRGAWAGAAATILLAPLVLCWPLPRVFFRELCAWRLQEAAVHAWGLWAALRERSPLRVETCLANWPEGVRFALVDPINLPAWALGSLFGPAAGFNTVLYAGVVVCGLGGALLARRAGGAPWLGALAAMACPTLIGGSFEGQTESYAVGWVAVQLALLLGFVERGGWWRGLLAAGALAAAGHAGPYNGVWAALADLAVLGALLARRRWPELGRGLLVTGGAALSCLPLAHALLTGRSAAMSGNRSGLPAPIDVTGAWRGLLHHGADLLDPWVPMQLTGGRPPMAYTAYLGMAAFVLGVLAVRRDRRRWPWLAGALAFSALSLGPWLYLRGRALHVGEATVMGPAGWGMTLVPRVLGRLTRWDRAGAVATLLLAPLVSTWGRGARGRAFGALAAALLVGDLLLCAPLAWPLRHAPPPDPTPLATLEGVGAVLELPRVTPNPARGTRAWRDQAALAQILHGRPSASASTLFATVEGSAAVRAGSLALRTTASLGPRQRQDLLGEGFTHLLVHLPFYVDPERIVTELSACFGPPAAQAGDVAVFDLAVDGGACRPPPPAPDPR
jgi:hypothetical protein